MNEKLPNRVPFDVLLKFTNNLYLLLLCRSRNAFNFQNFAFAVVDSDEYFMH